MYKACNSDKPLTIYIVMYANSNEEERYLCSLRKEQLAFEEMVREQGVCLIAIIIHRNSFGRIYIFFVDRYHF